MQRKTAHRKKNHFVSIIIPVFNEVSTIARVLKSIRAVKGLDAEVIVVDDASTDGTKKVLLQNKSLFSHLVTHKKNQGKSAAVKSGLSKATGEVVLIQDADLEYDPRDIPQLLEPMQEGHADVVYGSRFKGHLPHRMVYFSHYLVNLGLTFACNILTNLNLSDMETGYKVVNTKLLKSIVLTENGFGIEPELTLKLAARKARFYEVGIRYYGRTYEEGKKIGLFDGIQAVFVLVKYGIVYKLLDIPL